MDHLMGFGKFTIGACAWVLLFATVAAQGQSVAITEFVASNCHGLTDGEGNASDWIELHNGLSAAVSLEGWCLTDDRGNLRKWSFPTGTILPAGKYLVVFASGRAVAGGVYVDRQGYLHTSFALDKDGEYLALVAPNGTVVQEYAPRFPPQQADISYGLGRGLPRYFATPTPGQANGSGFAGLVEPTIHNHERGFYDQPFELRISCDTPEVQIKYTLDGSEPTDRHGLFYDSGTSIPVLTTTCVRSAAFKTDWLRSQVTTNTYILVDDVARQPANPPGWPDNWGYDSEVKGIVPADYAMDPRVVNSTLPGYSVREALLDIPTVAISMLPDDFVGAAAGIWTHPLSRWERKCSVEYILPDGADGFQHDCKIEVHGNSSRRPWRMQKHSLRLTFTSQYGPAKLHYPLFPESDVTEFNQLVLRGGFCDSWALVSWDASRYRPNDAQYIRDTWMKESLRAMGQPSSYGSFVHLYVNGLYFGLYNLSERLGQDFLAGHLGGQPEDWEVNEDFGTPGARWKAMMALDPSTRAGYTQMQQYLDLENLADYVLLHLYADAEDWPHHNGYAAANAKSGDGRFRFFVWDIASWIDKAIVAESARWGDVQMTTPYGSTLQQPNPLTDINHIMYPPVPHGPNYYFTREDSWIVERDNVINNYLPAIHNPANSYALIRLLQAKSLYETP
jgi:hypothetical protein